MRIFSFLLVLVAIPVQADDLGLKVPPNFKVTLWADHTLANDIYTMALDEKGRVVVSGPGYIRRLEDTDGDGKADKATDLGETKTGAMGICFRPPLGASHRRIISADGQLRGETYSLAGTREGNWTVSPSWPSSEHGGHAVKLGLDDINQDGIRLIHEIVDAYRQQSITTKVLSASLRNPIHVQDSALAGADIATMPFKVMESLVKHPLTDQGVERFLADYRKTQEPAKA